MKKRKLILVALFTIWSTGLVIGADKYTIDKAHTNVLFSVRHMVISTVQGRFNEFEGVINYDEKDIMKFTIEGKINVNSIDTNNERRDDDLKSDGFFDAEKYPEILFKTTKVEKRDDDYVAIGSLTIKDVTKEVEIPFEVLGKIPTRRGGFKLGLHATLEINRKDFNVKWHRTLDGGGLVVSDIVKIVLNIEANYRPPQEE
ncbi:polyisoprenoid-binding protein [candidate division KSB1 bacterium]|nr:polyisoprenoid-binding protein [candidate division KSB1 bacterium]